MKSSTFRLTGVCLTILLAGVSVHAEPPNLETPAPVIYLADNLDEPNQRGYCIDTIGRGFSERLQTHSCKPEGGDVQYRFEAATGYIASPTYKNKCAALMGKAVPGVKLALLDCADIPAQKFTYDEATQQLRPADRPDLCLVTAAESFRAGRYRKRELSLADCTATDAVLRQWVVKNIE